MSGINDIFAYVPCMALAYFLVELYEVVDS